MGKFDMDDVLRELGEERPDAPKEPDLTDVGRADAAPSLSPQTTVLPMSDASPSIEPREPSSQRKSFRPASCRLDLSKVNTGDALSTIFVPESDPDKVEDLSTALLRQGVVSTEQINSAQRVLKQTPGRRLEQVLIEIGVDEAAVQREVARLNGLPFERIDYDSDDAIDLKYFNRLTLDYCRTNLVLPLRREGEHLVVGTINPDDLFLLDEIRRKLGVPFIRHVLATGFDIRGVIENFTEETSQNYDVDEILADVDEDDVEVVREKDDDDSFVEEAESSPVVRYVNHIIQTAVKEGASDIHIEPGEKKLKVRFRIDGVLFEMMHPPHKMHAALTSRLKIMANLDIAERRIPQDGRIRASVFGRKLDLRLSTLPTANGEKTVMRILDNRSIQVGLDELGFAQDTLTIWKNQIDQPHGIILVTGPTGSGKTTTLYSSLRQMDTQRLNVSTVEDPVEYNLAGISQVQTHDRIGMTFAKALKALLRQDPDVIMVGEIRDMDTATIAIQAALTGHLVLSTLHTNDAPSSVTRLINIGIEPFLIGAALNAVLAQRLVRRICEGCKSLVPVPEDMSDFLTMHGVHAESLPHGSGCQRCRETGYIGRVGLYELLVLDDHLRDSVARNPSVTEFRRTCTERGMVTLREDGFQKVIAGLTTVEEILRVTEATI